MGFFSSFWGSVVVLMTGKNYWIRGPFDRLARRAAAMRENTHRTEARRCVFARGIVWREEMESWNWSGMDCRKSLRIVVQESLANARATAATS
jgi:hypothetical protein